MDSDKTGLDPARRYSGVVVDNNDPRQYGRIRFRISELFNGWPDDHLPWAVHQASHVGGASSTSGSVSIPAIGSKVWIQFQDGNLHQPIYVGYPTDATTVLEEAKTHYPNRHVHLLPNGTLFLVDTESNSVFVRGIGDTNFYITGNVNLVVDGNLSSHIKGNRTTFVDGTDTLVVGGEASTFAASIYEEASGNLTNRAGGTLFDFASGPALRDGSIIHDDPGSSPASAQKPDLETVPWPGIRDPIPS